MADAPKSGPLTAAAFAAAAGLAAALGFLLQPMTGKQLLPLAGGTPAGWTTCLLFFQAALLLGYLYADLLHRSRLAVNAQVLVHFAVAVAGLGLSEFGDRLAPNGARAESLSGVPVAWLLAVLAASAGPVAVPLFATAPLLQAWFGRTGRNPYPLYAASNVGSLLGLIGYPALVEPALPLSQQTASWLLGFTVTVWLVCMSGLLVPKSASQVANDPGPRPFSWKWFLLPALSSSLLAGNTAHLTTDIAPVPLLWVVPLAVYLLSYILTFGAWPAAARHFVGRTAPMTLCFLVLALLTKATEPLPVVAGVHLLGLGAACLLIHGELAASRPGASHATRFYLWVAAGGAAGGAFNAALAPFLFAEVGEVEYPLALVLTALVRPGGVGAWKRSDFFWAIGLGLAAFGLTRLVPAVLGRPPENDPAAELLDRVLRGGLMFGVPAAAAFALVWRPGRFALCLAAVLVAGAFAPGRTGTTVALARNFFGTLRVTVADDGYTKLVHGTTVHGMERTGGEGRPEPTTYYHRKGPLGRLFATLPPKSRRVGAVGLGCGAAAAYANAGDAWTFYEIDPNVERFARDERHFHFLSRCPAKLDVKLGDARRELHAAPAGGYDALILDAFNSDSIPTHLLTVEAFALYFEKLAAAGVIAVHVSNRYLDLPPLVARLAAAEAGVEILTDEDLAVTDSEKADGKLPAMWVIIARPGSGLKPAPGRRPLPVQPGPVWTDDFSNLLGVWKKDD